jgi:hypothetical protein
MSTDVVVEPAIAEPAELDDAGVTGRERPGNFADVVRLAFGANSLTHRDPLRITKKPQVFGAKTCGRGFRLSSWRREPNVVWKVLLSLRERFHHAERDEYFS